MSYAKDPRDRNMISYLMFARKDAYALTEWLLTDFDVAAVQDAFEAQAFAEWSHSRVRLEKTWLI